MTSNANTATASQPMDNECVERWDADCIKPFPAIALKALHLMAGTDTSLLQLCDLIRCDAGFSAAVLRIANSPLVGFPHNVSSVLQASMLLGFRRLRSIVITVGLKAYLSDLRSSLMRSCWRHSLASAIIAERAAKRMFSDSDFAYTAGILHDIGRVALTTVMPERYARAVRQGADAPSDFLRIEREYCGIDHCAAGRALVTLWDFPDVFAAITACHHDHDSQLLGSASLIAPSCALSDALGFSLFRPRRLPSYTELIAGFPDPARHRFPATAKELAAEVEAQIKVLETA